MEKLVVPSLEKRTLRYDFTAVEVHDLSVQLANETRKVVSLTEEKKSVTSQWTAKINEAKAACNNLSFKVSDGYEHREIDCEVIFNQPAQGKKTIIRRDSNMLVGVEAMTTSDWNLINEENNLFGGDPLKQEEPQLAEEETEEGE